MNLEPLGPARFSDWNRGKPLDDLHLSTKVLREASLTEASLTKANLRGADLRGADLSGAVLRDAELDYAVLNKAILCNTFMPDGQRIFQDCSRDIGKDE